MKSKILITAGFAVLGALLSAPAQSNASVRTMHKTGCNFISGASYKYECPYVSGSDQNVDDATAIYVDFGNFTGFTSVTALTACKRSYGGTESCGTTTNANYGTGSNQDISIATNGFNSGTKSDYDYGYVVAEFSQNVTFYGVGVVVP